MSIDMGRIAEGLTESIADVEVAVCLSGARAREPMFMGAAMPVGLP